MLLITTRYVFKYNIQQCLYGQCVNVKFDVKFYIAPLDFVPCIAWKDPNISHTTETPISPHTTETPISPHTTETPVSPHTTETRISPHTTEAMLLVLPCSFSLPTALEYHGAKPPRGVFQALGLDIVLDQWLMLPQKYYMNRWNLNLSYDCNWISWIKEVDHSYIITLSPYQKHIYASVMCDKVVTTLEFKLISKFIHWAIEMCIVGLF